MAPMKRIHIDFAGPFQGKMFFIKTLKRLLKRLPEQIVLVSDSLSHKMGHNLPLWSLITS